MMKITDNTNQSSLGSIVQKHRPDLGHYEHIYRDVHQRAELSCMEARTARLWLQN